MNMKKRILSGVMAVATMASIASAVPANANAISGKDLNARVVLNCCSGPQITSNSINLDWDDYYKSYASDIAQKGKDFKVTYQVETLDLTPGSASIGSTKTVSCSEYKATGLKPGHKYQFAISTLYEYKTKNNKKRSGYGGTNFVEAWTKYESLDKQGASGDFYFDVDYAEKRQVGTYGTYGNSTYYAYKIKGMCLSPDYGDVTVEVKPSDSQGNSYWKTKTITISRWNTNQWVEIEEHTSPTASVSWREPKYFNIKVTSKNNPYYCLEGAIRPDGTWLQNLYATGK